MMKHKFYRFLFLITVGWFAFSVHHYFPAVRLLRLSLAAFGPPPVNYEEYTQKFRHLGEAKLIHPNLVKSPVPNCINVGYLIVNRKKTSYFDETFALLTMDSLKKLLLHASETSPIHFILVTDEHSRKQLGQLIVTAISQILSEEVIKIHNRKKKRIPPLYFSLVDYQEIAGLNPGLVEVFMDYMKQDKQVTQDNKYTSTFFNIGPLYHLAFTQIDKMIFLDCQDLEFRSDIGLLNDQFSQLENTSAVIGMGLDLSTHYRMMMKPFNEIFNSVLGTAGRFQGFNSGVVLYHLKRMRENTTYNGFLNREVVLDLFTKYYFVPSVGDQDLFTILGYDQRHLFYILPCQFNTQTSLQYMTYKTKSYFDDYHFCDKFENIKIIHWNGCQSPKDCSRKGDPDHHASKMYLKGYYFYKQLDIDWVAMASLKQRLEKTEYKFVNYNGKQVMVPVEAQK